MEEHHHDDAAVLHNVHAEIDEAIVEEAINDSLIPSIPPLPPTPSDPGNQQQHLQQHQQQEQTQLFASLKLRTPPSTAIHSIDSTALTKLTAIHNNPALLASTLFVKDEIWSSKQALFQALSTYASLVGCKAVKSRDIIQLKSRISTNNTDKKGFYVKVRALHNDKSRNTSSSSSSAEKARPNWEREVQIREVSTVLPTLKRSSEDEVAKCPSAMLAYGLKRIDSLSGTVVGFDDITFQQEMKHREEHNNNNGEPTSYDMDAMASELFRRNDVWKSRDVLYHCLSSFASAFGFKVVKTRNMLVCKRYGIDNGNRNWSAGPWKVGCTFGLTLKALHTERKMTECPKDPERDLGPKCRPVWEREVLIKEANVRHGGGCRPGEVRGLVVKKAPKAVHPNVTVMKNAGLINLFTKIRDETTKSAEFVQYSKRIMRLLAEETCAAIPSRSVTIHTPTQVRYKGQLSVVDTNPEKVCFVSIIRAGDALLESFREIFPSVTVGKMWIQRDETSSSKEAIHSCTKLPLGMDEMEAVILCDPMLATGGSSLTALNTLVNEYGVKPERIVFANVISCPEGLDALAKNFPEVKIVTAWVDDGLNEEKFIVPGLGDYGDRFFNTVPTPLPVAAMERLK